MTNLDEATTFSDDDVLDDLSAQLFEAQQSYKDDPASQVETALNQATKQDTRAVDTELIELGYRPHAGQQMVHEAMTRKRFMVLVCHRRWGKTVLAVHALCDSAIRCDKPNGRYAYLAPFLKQAKSIAWMYVKAFASRVEGSRKHEGELYVEFPHNGARVTLFGGDNPEALRGNYFDGFVTDEPAQIKPFVWPEIIRPALADRKGWGLIIGTPRGVDDFFTRYQHAQTDPEWGAFMFRADETNLPWLDDNELGSIQRELTENQYRQEMLCDFNASSDDVIIPIDITLKAINNKIAHEGLLQGMERVIAVDPARFGDDDSVISHRWGRQLYDQEAFNGLDNMEVVSRLANLANELKPDAIFCDEGQGQGIIDRMNQLNYNIIGIGFGNNAINKVKYKDRRTEMTFDFREWMRTGGCIPDCPLLKAELSTPTYTFNANEQRVMCKKEKVRELLGRSPDRFDSAIMTVAEPVLPMDVDTRLSRASNRIVVDNGGYHPHKRLRRKR